MKECPEWMQFSTITSAEHLPSAQQASSSSEAWSTAQSTTGTAWFWLNMFSNNCRHFFPIDIQRDEKIKAELLAYEKSKPSFNQRAQDESSNSDDDNSGMKHVITYIKCIRFQPIKIGKLIEFNVQYDHNSLDLPTATSQQADDNSSESESESETDHFTMTVGHIHECIIIF